MSDNVLRRVSSLTVVNSLATPSLRLSGTTEGIMQRRFKLGKRGQITVYIADDIADDLMAFSEDQPIASASDICNAALRFYLKSTKGGVNGRLDPIHVAN